jgi:WD40 repeat protein
MGGPMKHGGEVVSAWVVTASADKTARLWNAATGEAIGEAMQHDGKLIQRVSVRTAGW